MNNFAVLITAILLVGCASTTDTNHHYSDRVLVSPSSEHGARSLPEVEEYIAAHSRLDETTQMLLRTEKITIQDVDNMLIEMHRKDVEIRATNLDNVLLGLALTVPSPNGEYVMVRPKADFDKVDNTDVRIIKDSLLLDGSATNATIERLVDRLFERNNTNGERTGKQLTLSSCQMNGYVVDYAGKLAEYFRSEGGSWPRLYKENPKIRAIVTVSLPVYDAQTGFVILYKTTQHHGLEGWGEVILYRHQQGRLIKLKSLMLWLA